MYQKAESSRGVRTRALQTTAIALAVLVNAPIASARPAALSGSVAADDTTGSATPVPPVAVQQNAPIDFSNKDTIAADPDSGSSVHLVSTAGSVAVTNNGTIQGKTELAAGNIGKNAAGPLTLSLVNSGAILGRTGLEAVDVKGAVSTISVDNSGSITNATPDSHVLAGLFLRRDVNADVRLLPASYQLHNSGKINAEIDPASAPEVESYGLIVNDPADETAATITNDATGVISAKGGTALAIVSYGGDLTVTNAGTISAVSAPDSIHAAIKTFGGDNSVTNSGAIVGDILLGGGDDVVANWGSINGNVKLGGGNDIFIEGENSAVTGTVDGGDGVDRFLHARKTTGIVNLLTDLPTNFELEGVRALGSGTVVTINAASPLTRGLQLDGDGAIVNTAEIQGRVLVAPAPDLAASPLLAGFQNTGKLGGGITGSLRRLDNDGTITAASGLAIDLYQADGLALNNHGTITHASDDVRAVYAVTSGGEITATNSGSIDGTTTLRTRTSADGDNKPLLVSLSNTGTISATVPTLASALTIDSSDTRGVATSLRVANTGSIQRVGLGTAVLVTASSDPSLTTAFKQSISVENSGVIAADSSKSDDDVLLPTSAGLLATGNGPSTTNVTNKSTGQITANGVRPIAILAGGGGFDLDNAGLIEATVATPSKQVPVAIASDAARVSIENKGKIVGNVELASQSAAITNSGTINGNVLLGNGDALFTAAGGSVNGLLSGGAGYDEVDVVAGTASPVSAFRALSDIAEFQVNSGKATISDFAQIDRIDLFGGSLVGLSGSAIFTKEVIVGKAATFGSAGVVTGNIVVAGTLSPGASPGRMRVIGDVSLQPGSRSLFELTTTAQDQLAIEGKLAIDPGATLVFADGSTAKPGTTYTLITATKGITGRYSTIQVPATLALTVTQGADRIDALSLFARSTHFSPLVNASIDYANQRLLNRPSAALAAHWSNLYDADGNSLPKAFARLTPQAYAAATQIDVDDALTLSQATRGPAFAPYAKDTGLFTFGQGLGGWHTLRADPATGSAPAIGRAYGALGGIGFADAGWVVGAFAGNLTNHQEVEGLGSETRVGSLVTGAHGRYSSGTGLGFSSAITFDGGRARTHRWLPDGRRVWSHYDLNSVVSDLSVFYALDAGHDWTLTPRAGVTYVRTVRGGAKEQGGSVFGLDVKSEHHIAGFADGALTLARSDGSAKPWRPYVTLGARYQLQGQGVRTLAGYADGPLTLAGIGASRAELVGTASAGVGYRPSDAIEIFAGASAQTGRDDHQESITAGVRARF